MRRTGEMMLVTLMLGAYTTAAEMEGARPATEARAQCRVYAKPLEHPGRMFDACMISKGHVADYSTVAGQVKVRSAKLPAQPPEQIAKDLKGCNDAVVGMGYEGRGQFVACIAPRGYTATSGD
jgi:hypothetical protein